MKLLKVYIEQMGKKRKRLTDFHRYNEKMVKNSKK